MKSIFTYTVFGFFALILCCSCKKQLDKRVSLWRMDKIPYGTKYAYENLASIFPKAVVRTGSHFPVLFISDNAEDTLNALIIIGSSFAPDPYEMRSIIHYAGSGNQVFISCLRMNDSALSQLHLQQVNDEFIFKDSGETAILDPSSKNWIRYVYPGFSDDSYFNILDSQKTTVIGKNKYGRANFVSLSYDHGGVIFIHVNPFAFSNFFLLHKKNKSYYDIAFSYLSRETGIVQWTDYFRYHKQNQEFSSFHFLFGQRSFRWAFGITILLLLFVFIFESKPRQRGIAEIPLLRNASEDFVKTVGRLYFQQKNNQNLALKMTSSFLENVRSAYGLSTSVLNEEFAQKLSYRTGKPIADIMQIIQLVHEIRLNKELSDQELLDLNQLISQFNKPE